MRCCDTGWVRLVVKLAQGSIEQLTVGAESQLVVNGCESGGILDPAEVLNELKRLQPTTRDRWQQSLCDAIRQHASSLHRIDMKLDRGRVVDVRLGHEYREQT